MSEHSIVEIEQYSKDIINSFMSTYLEIEEKKDKYQDLLDDRSKLFKKECFSLFQKLHKFISHYLNHAHKEILKSKDEKLFEWEALKVEVTQLSDTKNYNEVFFRRKQILAKKNEIKSYFEDYLRESENSLLRAVKSSIYQRFRNLFENLIEGLNFCTDT